MLLNKPETNSVFNHDQTILYSNPICFIKETWNINSRLLNTITMYLKIIVTFFKNLNLTTLAVPRLKVRI